MDRPFGDREADVGVRLHRPEGLAYVAKLDGRLLKFYGWLHVQSLVLYAQKRAAPDMPARRAFGFLL
jgi:hypothetical protein